MPRFRIKWELAGVEHSDLIECDTLNEAESEASDNLDRLISQRSAYSAELVGDDEEQS